MIYGALVGLILALDPAPFSVAIGVLPAMTALKALWGIAFRRTWVTRQPSHYARFLDTLRELGPVPPVAWLPYLVQFVIAWSATGLIVYGIGRLIWLPTAWWSWCLALYVGAGVLLGLRHLAAGKRGAAGPVVTVIAMAILWPAVIYTESRR